MFWNVTAGLAMFFGRYLAIILQLAFASSLMNKASVSVSAGTMKTNNVMFMILLVFPALALGPIAEHLTLWF